MQGLLGRREGELRSKVEADMKTAADDMVDKVCVSYPHSCQAAAAQYVQATMLKVEGGREGLMTLHRLCRPGAGG